MTSVKNVVICGSCDRTNKAATPAMMAILLRDKKEEPSVLSPLCCTKFEGSVRVTLNDSAAAYVAVWSSKANETDSSLLECIKDNFR